MPKENTFINKQFRNIVFKTLIISICSFAVQGVDYYVAYNFMGSAAASAVNIGYSATSIAYIVTVLFGLGVQILHARAIGRFDKKEATEYFFNGIIGGVFFGSVIAILIYLFGDEYLLLTGCTGQLFTDAKEYMTYMPGQAVLSFVYVIAYVAYDDGDYDNIMIASIFSIFSNILFGCLFVKTMGLRGLGLGSLLADVVLIAVASLHFIGGSSSLTKIKFHIDIRKILEIMYHGAHTGISYLLLFVMDITLTNFIQNRFGSENLTSYTMASKITQYSLVMQIIAQASIVIIGVCVGEKNSKNIKSSIKTIVKYCICTGIVFSLILICGSSLIPRIYGIESGEIFETVRNIFIMNGCTSIFTALVYVPIMLYSCLGHPLISILFTVLFYGVFTIGLGTVLANVFGFYGLIVGMAAASLITIIVGFIIVRLVKGKAGFPFYFKSDMRSPHVYCIDSQIPQSSRVLITMEKNLVSDGITKGQAEYIHEILNQLVTDIFDSNPNKRILIEIDIDADTDNIHFIIRDNGVWMDERSVKTLFNGRNVDYFITTSYNRYRFDIKREEA